MAHVTPVRETGRVEPQIVRYSERPELWDAIEDLSDEVWRQYVHIDFQPDLQGRFGANPRPGPAEFSTRDGLV